MYNNVEICENQDKAAAQPANVNNDIEDIIPLESVQFIAKQLLGAEQFFRLTIDLKKLKFVEPLQTRVIEDDDFVHSVSLSYLTAPLFQSSDVFHAIQIARNAKDPTELLISDGFCSFRFEDRLLWTDFARLFLPSTADAPNSGTNTPSTGAALPIFVRARQSPNEKKSTTIGVATLTFESFLSPTPPSVTDIPQSFYNNLVTSNVAAEAPAQGCDTKQCRELPIFEGLMKIPIITRESASIVGLLTLGVAIDLMLNANELSLLLSKSLHRVTPLHPIKSLTCNDRPSSRDTSFVDCWNGVPPQPAEPPCRMTSKQSNGAPTTSICRLNGTAHARLRSQTGRNADTWKQRLFHRKSQTVDRSRSSSKRPRGPSALCSDNGNSTKTGRKPGLPSAVMRRTADSPCSSANEDGPDEDEDECCSDGGEDAMIQSTNPQSSQLLQMEMLLMKLSAEQAHQKFREEIRCAEKKAEEKVAEVKQENQKLKTENQTLETKLAELEKKLQGLQKALEADSPARRKCDMYRAGSDRSTSREPNHDTIEELRRQNERLLQLLLRQSSQNHQPLWHPSAGCHGIPPADFQQILASLSPPRTRAGNPDLAADMATGRSCVNGDNSFTASTQIPPPAAVDPTLYVPPSSASSTTSSAFSLPHCVSAPPRSSLDTQHEWHLPPSHIHDQPLASMHRQTTMAWSPPGMPPATNETAAGLRGCNRDSARRPPMPVSTRQGRLPTRHNRNRSASYKLSDPKGVRSEHISNDFRPPSPPPDPSEGNRRLHNVSSATCGSTKPKSELLEPRRSAGASYSRCSNDDQRRPSADCKASGTTEGAQKRMRSGSSSNSSSVSSSPLTSRSKQLLAELLKKSDSS